MSYDPDLYPEPPPKKVRLCYCGKPVPAHEDRAEYLKCRAAHQDTKRKVWLVDHVTSSNGKSTYEPHIHKPSTLNLLLQGPNPTGLVIERQLLLCCSTCHLVYWQQLDPVMPSVIQKE